jgi:hypothetical protein
MISQVDNKDESENKEGLDNQEENSNQNKIKGEIELENKKMLIILEISQNFLHFTTPHDETDKNEEELDLFITYHSIIFFAVNQSDNFILFNYGSDQQIKYYPEEKDKLRDIYEQIQHNNMLNPSNELYTAESFKYIEYIFYLIKILLFNEKFISSQFYMLFDTS